MDTVDIQEDQTSIFKRKRTPKPLVVLALKREDLTGPQKQREEIILELVDADTWRLFTDWKRMDLDMEVKLKRK